MSVLNTELLPLEEKLLFTPSLDEISSSEWMFFSSASNANIDLLLHVISSIEWIEE